MHIASARFGTPASQVQVRPCAPSAFSTCPGSFLFQFADARIAGLRFIWLSSLVHSCVGCSRALRGPCPSAAQSGSAALTLSFITGNGATPSPLNPASIWSPEFLQMTSRTRATRCAASARPLPPAVAEGGVIRVLGPRPEAADGGRGTAMQQTTAQTGSAVSASREPACRRPVVLPTSPMSP